MIDEIVAVFIEGIEWYLEKRGSRKILARSRNLGSAFDGFRNLVFERFLRLGVSIFFYQRISESQICRFLFPFGLQESKCFRDHGYSLSN